MRTSPFRRCLKNDKSYMNRHVSCVNLYKLSQYGLSFGGSYFQPSSCGYECVRLQKCKEILAFGLFLVKMRKIRHKKRQMANQLYKVVWYIKKERFWTSYHKTKVCSSYSYYYYFYYCFQTLIISILWCKFTKFYTNSSTYTK